jgi:hypothetical protein
VHDTQNAVMALHVPRPPAVSWWQISYCNRPRTDGEENGEEADNLWPADACRLSVVSSEESALRHLGRSPSLANLRVGNLAHATRLSLSMGLFAFDTSTRISLRLDPYLSAFRPPADGSTRSGAWRSRRTATNSICYVRQIGRTRHTRADERARWGEIGNGSVRPNPLRAYAYVIE